MRVLMFVKGLRGSVLFAALALSACAPSPLRTSLPHEWVASPGFDARRPNYVVLHHTSSATLQRALGTLTDPASGVSSHYLIDRDGRLLQLVDERQRAWHAGASYWGGNTDLNSASIGIELVNDGNEPFPEPQIAKLLELLADLRERHRIPSANVLGHGDVAPRRKVDPSHLFPWRRLAGRGFGLWCGTPSADLPSVHPETGSATLLQAIGYDVTDLPATIAAFRRHFLGDPSNTATQADLGEAERALAQCLARRGAAE